MCVCACVVGVHVQYVCVSVHKCAPTLVFIHAHILAQVVDQLNRLGYDVFEMMMPLLGCNPVAGGSTSHDRVFLPLEEKGDYTMRFFIEPVALAVGHAKRLGYEHIVMLGLSGGGWTTTVAAAALPDIALSIPVAGSLPTWPTVALPTWVPDLPEGRNPAAVSPDIFHPPPELSHPGGDYEQHRDRPMYAAVGGYAQLYVLGALERGRAQLQVLHEFDSCCFRAAGLHDPIRTYNKYVQARVGGWMQTAVTSGNFHEVNARDLVLVAMLVERLRRKGAVGRDDMELLPFDDLQA